MIKLRCIRRFRNNNGKITQYTLVEDNGTVHVCTPDELKYYIRSGEYIVTNLKLTSNNRLIDHDHRE